MRSIIVLAATLSLAGSVAFGDVLITEINSKSDSVQEDFFELTNLGGAPLDITGWQYDDESMSLGDAVPLEGVTTIAAGESVVIIQLDVTDPFDPSYDPAAEVANFRSDWGGLTGVQVGYHTGAGLGKGDAATIFDATDAIVAQLAYGDGEITDPGDLIADTHAGEWAGGNEWDSAIWIPGSDPAAYTAAADGVYGSFANTFGNYGSPGVIPEPASLVLLAIGSAILIRRR